MKKLFKSFCFILIAGLSVFQARWGEQCSFVVGSLFHPHVECTSPYSGKFEPLSKSLSYTSNFNPSVASLVSGLLRGSSPPAVTGLVVPVHINAIDNEAIGAASHVGQEVLVSQPTFTNSNAASPVEPVEMMIGIATARTHIGPSSVFWGFLPVTTFTMPSAIFATLNAHILAITSTGSRSSAPEDITSYGSAPPTIASAQPGSFAIGTGYLLFNNKSAKSLAYMINGFHLRMIAQV